MPVAVYPADLEKRGGFMQTAKQLRRLWPRDHVLTHIESCEILAHGLGYTSFQQLRMVSRHTTPDAPIDRTWSAEAGIWMFVVFHRSRMGSVPFSVEQADELVDSLSLNRLLGVKQERALSAAEFEKRRVTSNHALPGLRAWEHPSSLESGHQLDMLDPDGHHVRLFTEEEWSAIGENIRYEGSLRDKSIWRLVCHWLGGYQIANLKLASRIEIPDSLPGGQHSPKRMPKKRFLPTSVTRTLTPYIQAHSLSGGDNLFPATTPAASITIQELNDLAVSWTEAAGIERRGVSFESFSRTVQLQTLYTSKRNWQAWKTSQEAH